MEDNEVLALAFPGDADRIEELCSKWPSFDAICQDFLLLYRERHKATENPDGIDDDYLADLVEGLTDLCGEIETMLHLGREATESNQKK